ncbi:hypothetical protein ACH5RR_034285 [Cinchona calisaya]|uniref:Uncharacterized protein n=1 Tax=Cinchona calisaya TaxID=153742 RepID=A0ABD2YEB3_9GENT
MATSITKGWSWKWLDGRSSQVLELTRATLASLVPNCAKLDKMSWTTTSSEGSVPTVYSVAVGMHENCADLKDVLARASPLKVDEKLLLAKVIRTRIDLSSSRRRTRGSSSDVPAFSALNMGESNVWTFDLRY